jgi:hypothetical protein
VKKYIFYKTVVELFKHRFVMHPSQNPRFVASSLPKLTPCTKNYLTKKTSCCHLKPSNKFLFSMKEDANPEPSISP